ncbi:MAG: cyclic nucleotide-binding domain-containing protein [Anaerolineae bacterium]|nr:cyclic nucleotide-binding domain-containing protein [Anaerolineae bacterium]
MTDPTLQIRTLLYQEIRSLKNAMERIHLQDGEILFQRGDPGDAFYVIESGQVRVFTYDERGKELTLNTLQAGEAFGELALVDDQPRSASVSAVGPVTLLQLCREDFVQSVHSSPALTQAVIQLLSERSRHMISYVEWLGQWTRLVAEGHYDQAMNSLDAGREAQDDALAAVADAVGSMVQVVKKREEQLRQEVAQLQIQIDEKKRQRHVAEITETDYFKGLAERANRLRQRAAEIRKESAQPISLEEVTMSKIVSIHSFRGGTGKSNISANVAAQLAVKGHRVGVIDTDIQSPGIHVLFGMDEEKIDKALNDYLWGRCAIEETAYDVGAKFNEGEVVLMSGGMYLIPSSLRAGEIARVLQEGYDVGMLNEGFQALIEKLNLDYLIIDTHPGLNEETLLSIAISDILIIILRPDQQDFQGTAVTVDVARKLDVPTLYMVVNKALTSYDFDDLRRQVEETYDSDVASVIPLSEDVARLQSSDIFSLRYPGHAVSEAINQIVTVVEKA